MGKQGRINKERRQGIRANDWSFLESLHKAPRPVCWWPTCQEIGSDKCADLLCFSEGKVFRLRPDEAFLLL